MVKLVLRLSKLAKGAFVVSLVGCALALYGKQKGVAWAGGTGSIMFFGGVVVYLIERMRMLRTRQRPRDDH